MGVPRICYKGRGNEVPEGKRRVYLLGRADAKAQTVDVTGQKLYAVDLRNVGRVS